ncbi:MAG: hypothetical protein EKK49_11235 [Rhodocyclaceae bacterium]|nr:MAG: hypothetical protein EKK49_11235 [Rhodocyclaceae bacterium]
MAALTTAQVQSGLTTAQVVALTTSQVQALTTASVAAFTTAQLVVLETTDLVALKTSQIVALTTAQVQGGLTTTQVAALTTTQVEALTSTQVAALTTTQISHLKLGTPLVLDLNGDGVTTQSISSGVSFDLFATGQKVQTGWVAGGDGLLVLDRNHDNVVNDGSELFGSATKLADGSTAANGYAALAALDTNGDGSISSADTGFSDLKVWVDGNSDGISQADELHSLDSLGIVKLNLDATASSDKNNGNIVGLISSYETSAGVTREMADVWFVADKNGVASSSGTTAEPSTGNDLQSKVGGLVGAIASFNAAQAGGQNAESGGLGFASGTTASSVSGVVTVLNQFDANGRPLAGQPGVQGVATKLGTSELVGAGQNSNGILTNGK